MNVSPLIVQGHDRALQALRELRASSLLLVGPEGVGRRRSARWLAALQNCLAEGDRPCGDCDSCNRFASGHPDYREVQPRSTTSTGRRNPRPDIRIGQLVARPGEDDPLSHWLEQRPAFRRRVGVIDGAETMTVPAANSFLKMLEEPPSYATIVLIAPSPQAVLPTIASRCAIVRFGAVETSHLGLPGHPAHRLGRPGPLLEAGEETARARESVAEFVAAIPGPLDPALQSADSLAQSWQDPLSAPMLPEILREGLRELPPAARVRADDSILACQEAISGYSPPVLAARVLMLELRSLWRQ